jgi:ADP-ribose pyrophosphatase YjhB (NUDIX family)
VKYKKISFDWDNTIAMSYMIDSEEDSDLPVYTFQGYNDKLINLIKDYYNQNIELFIVTSRKRDLEQYYPEDSVEYQLKLLKIDHIFPPARVHYTEGKLKARTLLDLGVELHYDDSMEEVLECKKAGIEVIPSMKFHSDANVVAKGIIRDIHDSILLLKRTDEGTKWDIPGGHIKKIEHERGLKGLADGFEREVAEETGLIVPNSKLIHRFEHTWKTDTNDMHILLTDFAQEEPQIDLNVQEFQENSEFLWVPEDELDQYIDDMTEVAQVAVQYYLENVDNPLITEAKYLPSQSRSWARMKKRLVGLGINKHTGGGEGHTRPKMKKSKAAPPDFAVLEEEGSKKKRIRVKIVRKNA